MPRVLFISYSAAAGGAERLLLDWALAVPGGALVACPEGPLAVAARAAGLGTLVLSSRSLALRSSPAARLRAAVALAAHAREVRRLARNLEPDLVVAWGMRTAIAWWLSGAARTAPARAGGRGGAYAFVHNDFAPGRLIAAAIRAAAASAAVVVAPSQAVARDLDPRGRLTGRLHVVAPGVDVDRFAELDGPVARPPEILVLGALVGWKRVDLALETVAIARRSLPELRLRIAGAPLEGDGAGDELLRSLRARAAAPDLRGAVSFDGHLADPRAALAAATCLLHCASREPFGIAVLEALAAGRPAVVPDAGGPAEIVDSSCGAVYAPGDATAAAAALVSLVSDPERAAKLGRHGRRRAEEHFTRAASQARFGALVSGAPASRAGGGRHDAEPGSLALVTVTHNSAPELTALLDSVTRHLPGVAVIVVDCASRDESVAVAQRREGVTVIALEENVGFGRAVNLGLGHVTAPAVALVNPDVELLDDSLLALAGEALRADRPPRLLAPRVLNGDGSLQDTAHPVPSGPADLVATLIPPAALPGRAGLAVAPWRSATPRAVGWAVGCAIVARTGTLRELGPFDESIFLYGEDLELGLHARERGVATWLWPSARVVHHRAHSSAAAFAGEPFQRLAAARHDVVRRRLGRRRAVLDDAAQALTFASRIAVKTVLGRPAARERAQLRAVRSLRRGDRPR
ncbi:MAG TPA: glycosyltransferase [Solirubrobacteraceae bacterium]|nr:glycosyltransferase [Solirubrobacteraceae bacterium]